jgi:hypothetical protein
MTQTQKQADPARNADPRNAKAEVRKRVADEAARIRKGV